MAVSRHGQFGRAGALATALALVALALGCRPADAPSDAAARSDDLERQLQEALEATGARRGDAPAAMFTKLEPGTVTIGDRVRYTVELETAPGVELLLPEFERSVAGLPILEQLRGQREFSDGATLQRLDLWLRADRVGSFTLPEVSALDPSGGVAGPSGQQELEQEQVREGPDASTGNETFVPTAPERTLLVESVLPPDAEALDIRDVKPVRRVETGWPWWRWGLLAFAGLLAGLAALRWWRGREARAQRREHRRMLSAHEWAFARLEELRRTDFDDLSELRRYYFQLSEVLRSYIEQRFALNATDLTSEEILARARELSGLDVSLRRRLAGFLIATDMVKYAAQVPAREEIEETFEAAMSFVEQTVPRPDSGAEATTVETLVDADSAVRGGEGEAPRGGRGDHEDSAPPPSPGASRTVRAEEEPGDVEPFPGDDPDSALGSAASRSPRRRSDGTPDRGEEG